ncbi:two-partner secretion domain-containing protein [Aliarcobacter butzleri]|uniref:two-partner secretion domain-containing protein n=1 Tax=Aliarcobacter butzleri TaxID=28197 RepID=UPI002B24B3AD|nr:filamentous hemagglutinin N-terminal domain-containing protein [Aliarcobacter butzleri]
MKIFTKQQNKIYSVILSTLLTIQPLAINLNASTLKLEGGGANQPKQGDRDGIDITKNGVPVININTPNNKGISHNSYNHFNVDTNGLVLNNNATNINTKLAGWVEGNSNLRANNEAKLILNEVISNNSSLIRGLVEVAGRKADVIIANPNGITLNGAGFINTDKLTFTTGTPFFNNNGNLERFVIKSGNISIDGDNSFLAQSQLDILSQTLQVNKKLQANKLNILLGTNEIDATTLEAKAISSQSPTPNLSLDVSTLGGMYANAISLQATQKGVGVNMQGELLSQDDLTLDINGNITLNKASLQSKNSNVSIKSSENILLNNNSSISANKDLDIVSKNLVLNSSNLSSVEKINLQIDEALENKNNSTIITQNNNINITSNTILNDNSKIISGNNIDFKTQDFTNTNSLVFAINDVSITNKDNQRANKILNKNSDIVAFDGNLILKAQEVTNQGTAPTFIKDGYIATWYEVASGTNKDVFTNTFKLFKDDIKDTNTKVKTEYYRAYLDLLSSLMKNIVPSEESKELIKDTLLNPNGTIQEGMIGTWLQLSGKATQEGITDYDSHLKSLLKADIQNSDGSVKDEYLEKYISLWEKSINGEDLSQDVLDMLSDDVKDQNGYIKSSITSIWKNIRTVAGAGYEIKKTLTADILNNDGQLAQLISGKNIDIDTNALVNNYANISANGNIDIKSDTSIKNNAYGASQMLHEVHKTGCFTCHEGSIGFREVFGGIIEAKGNINLTANSLANTITATSNKTLNLPRIDKFYDLRSKYVPTPKSYVVLKDVKNNIIPQEERDSLIDVKANAINSKYIEESFIDYEKFIDTTSPTHYGQFLSSDYMMERLKYFPEYENRLNSDEWVLNIASQGESTINGKNVTLNIKDKIVLEGGVTAQEDLTIDSDGNLTSTAQLISGNDTNIAVAELNQIGGGIKAKNLDITTTENLNLTGTEIKVDENISLSSLKDINLDTQRQVTSGKRGITDWINSRDIGTSLEANGSIKLDSKNDINLVASRIESLGSSVSLNADNEINLFAGENYQEFSWTKKSTKKSGLFKKKTTVTNHHEEHLTHTGSLIKAKDDIELNASKNITLEGSSLVSRNGDIDLATQGDVNILSVEDKHLVEHTKKTSKSFLGIKYGSSKSTATTKSTITQGSISDAMGNISSKAGGTTTIQASSLNAGGNITINSSKGIQILSGKDTYDYEYESKDSSLGSLLTKEQKETLNKAKTVSSLINAKEVNLVTDDGIVLKGSQIQANTVNMLASYLALISDKNSEQYSSFTDGSGVILRTIINQGYIKEEAVPSTITANEISLNGKKLLEDSLNPDNLLKQISSEYDLNEEQITQIKAELTNKDWYDKTTTLSKMGMIIVQVVVAIVTAGALSTAIGALANNMASSAIAQTMIKGAITSIVSQLGSALVTSAITGNKLDLDVEKILINSIKAAALAGIVDQIDTNLGYTTKAGETLSYADKVSQQILHGFARASVYGGDVEAILASSLGNVAFEYIGHELYSPNSPYPQIQEYIPKTAIHSIVGGALAELAGGDFSQGAIATAVSHNVADLIGNTFLDKAVKNELTTTQAEEIIKGISSIVSGAVVLATHENVTQKELDISQDMASSVVTNNYLKDFDAHVQFGKGIIQGGGEKLWEDLKALGIAISSPIETLEALGKLVTSPEAMIALGIDVWKELNSKYENVYDALYSEKAYAGIEALNAGKDLGDLALTILETYGGVKGITTGTKAASEVLQASKNKLNNLASNKLIGEAMENGIKISPEKVVDITKVDGKIVWLETGNSSSGLHHIIERHSSDFNSWGIESDSISKLISNTIKTEKPVGNYGKEGSVYKIMSNGEEKYLNVVISKNGYIVTSHPLNKDELNRIKWK